MSDSKEPKRRYSNAKSLKAKDKYRPQSSRGVSRGAMRLVALDIARHTANTACQAAVILAIACILAAWLCASPSAPPISRTLFATQAALALTSACLTASLSVSRVLARWKTRNAPETRPKTCVCCQFCNRAFDLVATAGALATVAVAHIADRIGQTHCWAELGLLHTIGLIFVLVPLPGCCSDHDVHV